MAKDIMDILEAYGEILRRYLSDEEMKKTYGPVYEDWKQSNLVEEKIYGKDS